MKEQHHLPVLVLYSNTTPVLLAEAAIDDVFLPLQHLHNYLKMNNATLCIHFISLEIKRVTVLMQASLSVLSSVKQVYIHSQCLWYPSNSAAYFHYMCFAYILKAAGENMFFIQALQSVNATSLKNFIYLPGSVIHDTIIRSSERSRLNILTHFFVNTLIMV